jgi:pyruvate dehydrogenase E2 component (dihydrolipoamide acetyltransferase)
MPKLSPTMEVGTIAKWHVKEGDSVDAGQLLMEVSTDKATVEFNALDPGYIRKIVVKEGQEVKVNDTLAIMTEEKNEPVEEIKQAPKLAPPAESPSPPKEEKRVESSSQESSKEVIATSQGRPFASPLARSLAKERGIDLSRIKGSGPRGRIMSRDLEGATKFPSQMVEEPLSPIRKVIASRLQQAKRDIPHFYVQQAIDASALASVREQLKDQGITVNDLLVRGAALALKEHPEINSGFDVGKNVILRFPSIDISIAVDIPGGLITPIVFQADKKSVLDLSKEIKGLVKKARDGKLQPHEFQGGSFSISNLGMFGITSFSAVINPPQGAIIAIGGYQERLKRLDGEIVPYQEMVITLSVDHRVIDGASAARFLKTLKSFLESPALLLV